jgi:hypothetical protein
VSRYTAWEPFCLVVTLLVGITSTYALLNARRRWLEWDMGVVDVRNTPPQPFSTTYPIPGSRR